ncbi:E3 ubiquitin-protein ligase MPSR1-like [Salvia hispanica]|uniref:E3 ubiquitin-protein ligase MPSR1-like n=1 Tax=Salvia hispanica TaxID=49212 RepID=UPI002009BECD|nr:E3 ubiquitin-protein ligase MPSR1-like [Salvia hispanica]
MSSEATSPRQSQPFPTDGALPFFLPFILGVAALNPPPDADDHDHHSDRLVLINPITQTVIILDGSDASFLPPKSGRRPASKASIDALPAVEVASEEQCAICLEGWEEGEKAKEMACKHRFHGGCIERWLNVSGSCPVCRYEMPEEERGRRAGVWMTFSFGAQNQTED